MRFAIIFSLLFLCFSAFAQTDAPGNITIQTGGIIQYTPHADATHPIQVKYTKRWTPEGKHYELFSYNHVVILKRWENGSFEFAKYMDAFCAAVEDYNTLIQRK